MSYELPSERVGTPALHRRFLPAVVDDSNALAGVWLSGLSGLRGLGSSTGLDWGGGWKRDTVVRLRNREGFGNSGARCFNCALGIRDRQRRRLAARPEHSARTLCTWRWNRSG